MALNFLQKLFSAGPGLDGSDVSEPGMNMPGAGLAPPQAPITTPPDAANTMQNLNPGVQPNVAPVQPDQPAVAPRARRSILDTVGRLADVFAKVGGAEALYQPTLDGREDRALALGDHARAVDLDKLKLETSRNALGDADRARLAQAVRGTQAILTQNPKADPAAIFTALAQRAGVSADQAKAFAGQLGQDPSLLEGVAGFDDNGDKYSGSVVYGKDPVTGKVTAFQPNLKGGKARSILPDGVEAADTVKVVDTGGNQVVIDPRTGKPINTLGKTATPDAVLGSNTKITTTRMNNTTATTIAGMPARAKPAAAGADTKVTEEATGMLKTLDDIQSSFDKLHKLNALPGEGSVVGNFLGTLGRTSIGQKAGAITGLSDAAQERELLSKNLGNLQSKMLKSLPGAATRTKFEQEIQKKRLPDSTTMSYSTANTAIAQLRDEYQRALKPGYASDSGPAKAAPTGTRKLPPRIGAPAGKVLRYNAATGKIE